MVSATVFLGQEEHRGYIFVVGTMFSEEPPAECLTVVFVKTDRSARVLSVLMIIVKGEIEGNYNYFFFLLRIWMDEVIKFLLQSKHFYKIIKLGDDLYV